MRGTVISAPIFRIGLLAAGQRLHDERQALGDLDATAGDGDLGATLATGFAHVREALDETGPDDVGQLLTATGSQLARKAPSTIGALLATAFMRAGATLHGVTELSADDIRNLLQACFDGVAERGGAALGQRTILDAMGGAVEAAADAADAGLGAIETLRCAATGAVISADATAKMEPVFGRAAWIAARARGARDAGAVAWAIYLDGLAEECASASFEEVVKDR